MLVAAAAVAAVRLIVVDSKTYHVLAIYEMRVLLQLAMYVYILRGYPTKINGEMSFV